MSSPLSRLPGGCPHGAYCIGHTKKRPDLKERPTNPGTTKKRRGRNATLLNRGCCPAKKGCCPAGIVLRRGATLPRRQAFQRRDRP